MRKRLGLSVLLGTVAQLSAIALIALSAYLISRAWQQPPILHLMVVITSVRLFGTSRGVFRYAERVVSHDTAFRGMEKLRVAMWRKLVRLAPAPVQRSGRARSTGEREPSLWRNGDVQTRLIDDVDGVGQRWIRGPLPVITTLLTMAAAIAVQFVIYPPAGWIMAAAATGAAVLAPAMAALSDRSGARATARARADLTADVQAFLAGREELVAAGTASRALRAMEHTQRGLSKAETKTAWTAGLAGGSVWIAMAVAVVGGLYVAVPAVESGRLPGVELAVLALTPLAAFESLQALPQAVQEAAKSRASGRRLRDVSESPIPRPDPVDPMDVPVDPSSGPPCLEAKNLQLTWPGASHSAVRGLTFTVRPGEHIGIHGPSGAGKSSLAAALAGFVAYQGSLRIGGIEYSELTGDAVRENVALCSQEAYVFDATVAENLKIARPEASVAELERTLRWAGLRDWYEQLESGLDTRLGEFGKEISGGEKGRIALARAFLADREIVVIDELDAHLDAALARRVLRTAVAALEGKTAIIISHRPFPTGVVDRVLELSRPDETVRLTQNRSSSDLSLPAAGTTR